MKLLLEISTDKVDSEIPCPTAGKVLELLFNQNDTVEVNTIIARIGTEDSDTLDSKAKDTIVEEKETPEISTENKVEEDIPQKEEVIIDQKSSNRVLLSASQKHSSKRGYIFR